MFFRKKTVTPSIENESEYIYWFIKNNNDLKYLLVPYNHNLEKFLQASVRGCIRMLNDYRDRDALFNRVTELSTAYVTDIKPFVDKSGGYLTCSPELRNAVVITVISIYVGIEFLNKKYGYRQSIDLLNAIKI